MTDTIAAIATPPGRGGVGIIRISGPRALAVGRQLIRRNPELPIAARHALFSDFYASDEQVLDQGLFLAFPAPNSFTGEDVVELQGHGGPVVLDLLLREILSQGVRLARPGEFSERAFLNDKMDLTQAEAIADLIEAGSEQAARSALNSLQGEFSRRINEVLEGLINLRLHVESAIDFPDEEIDFLADGQILARAEQVIAQVQAVFAEARQGTLLQEGMRVVIAGSPNAGKSSLLNALSGQDSAIVTDIAGTTRDVLREQIQIDGMPLHIIDTAGLRQSPDVVEREGIRRAYAEIDKADRLLFVWDMSQPEQHPEITFAQFFDEMPRNVTFIANHCDRVEKTAQFTTLCVANVDYPCVVISARYGQGLDLLREHLKQIMGFASHHVGGFSARRRHLDALQRTLQHLEQASHALTQQQAGELAAEDLRLAQNTLSEITGMFSSDDLLGRIFSSFCIGK